MKNLLLTAATSIMLLANVTTVSPIRAQMNPLSTPADSDHTLPITVTIPEQWKSVIVREDAGGVATFGLDNENSAPFYLFSVTEIPDQLWGKTKTQIPDANLIAQKNGMIYFTQKTTKEKIKGPNSEVYKEIYPYIDQLIASIKIN